MKVLDFRQTRWLRRFNFACQALLIGLLFVLLAYGGGRFYKRYDMSASQKNSLALATIEHLQKLKAPVKIIAILTAGDSPQAHQVQLDLRRLLREYEYASSRAGQGQIKAEFVDPFRQNKRAQELTNLYKLSKDNVILVCYEDRVKEVLLSDLYEVKKGDIRSFRGEYVLTKTILDLSQLAAKKVYFLQGHGEMSPLEVHPARGLSELAKLLEFQNYEWDILDLTENRQIPTDADLIILASPQVPYLSYEVQQLNLYLESKGGTVWALLSATKEHGLEGLFYQWGIRADNQIVVDIGDDFQSKSGDFLIRRFFPHPITQKLIDYQLGLVWGLSRPIVPDITAPKALGLHTVSLLASSDQSWAKALGDPDLTYKPAKDLKGPLSLAMVAEKKIAELDTLQLESGKVIVMGNADFVSNYKLNLLGNSLFVLHVLNWATDHNDFLDIPYRQSSSMHLVLSKQDLKSLALRLSLIPLLLGLVGLGVAWKRRF